MLRTVLSQIAVIASIAVLSSACPEDAASGMQLPIANEGHLEVCVSIGSGVAHLFRLLPVWRTTDGVSGERIVWSTAADSEHIRQLIKREYCEASLQA